MKKLVYILFLFASIGFGQQSGRPSSTITAQTGTGDYTDTDEITASDTDYLTSDDNTNTTWETLLSSMTDPQTHFDHIIRYRVAQADGNSAPSSGGSSSSFSAYLYQGATLIATMSSSVTTNESSFFEYVYYLTKTEIGNITDYTDLRIRMDFVGGGGSPGNRRGVGVSWVEMEIISTRPTIALNTSNGFNFGADDTPTIEFTGTDVLASNDLEYEVGIYSGTSVVDSYSESNWTGNSASANKINAQSFTGDGSFLNSCQFYMYLNSTSKGLLFKAVLYAHSGTYGTSSVGTGSALASSYDVSTDVLSTSQVLISFQFDGTYQLVNGTKYVIGVEYYNDDTLSASHGKDITAPSHSGNYCYYNGSTWTAESSSDLIFYVNGGTFDVLADSTTDSGFLNTVSGGDTHPFNEDEKISYTVQAGDALADGTYTWYAVCRAPSGVNIYTADLTTRTFIVNSAGGTRRIFIIN